MRLRKVFFRNIIFWSFIAALMVASVFFTHSVELTRKQLAKARLTESIADNTKATVVAVIDGDEVTVKSATTKEFVVRILGIKAFSANRLERQISTYGKRAMSELQQLVGKDVQLRFSEFKKDSRGRVLAYVELEGQDVGKRLIGSGWAIVYELYPFERMTSYLTTEREALTERRGLWGNDKARERSLALKVAWEAMKNDV